MKSKLEKVFGSVKPLSKKLTPKQMRNIAMEDKIKSPEGFYETIRIKLPTKLLEDIKKIADKCDVDFEDVIKLYLYTSVNSNK